MLSCSASVSSFDSMICRQLARYKLSTKRGQLVFYKRCWMGHVRWLLFQKAKQVQVDESSSDRVYQYIHVEPGLVEKQAVGSHWYPISIWVCHFDREWGFHHLAHTFVPLRHRLHSNYLPSPNQMMTHRGCL